eukprot:2453173-Rhodomonas_salina.5
MAWETFGLALDRQVVPNPVSAYTRAMRCPVLTYRSCLRACYAMSGTDDAYQREADEAEAEKTRLQVHLATCYALCCAICYTIYAICYTTCYVVCYALCSAAVSATGCAVLRLCTGESGGGTIAARVSATDFAVLTGLWCYQEEAAAERERLAREKGEIEGKLKCYDSGADLVYGTLAPPLVLTWRRRAVRCAWCYAYALCGTERRMRVPGDEKRARNDAGRLSSYARAMRCPAEKEEAMRLKEKERYSPHPHRDFLRKVRAGTDLGYGAIREARKGTEKALDKYKKGLEDREDKVSASSDVAICYQCLPSVIQYAGLPYCAVLRGAIQY